MSRRSQLKKIRYFCEYLLILIPYYLIRLAPHFIIRMLAKTGSKFAWSCILPVRKIIIANLNTAFPEKDDEWVVKIGKTSLFNTFYNILDYIWMMGKPARMDRCLRLPEHIYNELHGCAESGTRIIFVNPHLGSWEASGIIATNIAGVKMAAIAKITRNPFLNNLLNKDNRERGGIKIIFSKGAVRETLKCLNSGTSIGTLIDQNTRLRDGGIFVKMFGIQVTASRTPATLWNYCRANDIPAKVIYGTTLRSGDLLTPEMEFLSKDYSEYPDENAIIQELTAITEKYVRLYPDQYLWLYQRFKYIPKNITPEIRARYPFYAIVPNDRFFSSRAKTKSHKKDGIAQKP